jgi:hypothetical protein
MDESCENIHASGPGDSCKRWVIIKGRIKGELDQL